MHPTYSLGADLFEMHFGSLQIELAAVTDGDPRPRNDAQQLSWNIRENPTISFMESLKGMWTCLEDHAVLPACRQGA